MRSVFFILLSALFVMALAIVGIGTVLHIAVGDLPFDKLISLLTGQP